jgi:hypothetical protein
MQFDITCKEAYLPILPKIEEYLWNNSIPLQ